MLNQMQKAGRNKANLDMIQNSNRIQQQQT